MTFGEIFGKKKMDHFARIDNYRQRAIKLINVLESGDGACFLDIEIGFGCNLEFVEVIKNANQRGVRITILCGPYIMVDDKSRRNYLVDYRIKDDPRKFNIHILKNMEDTVRFKYAFIGENIIVAYPHKLSDGNEDHSGFQLSNVITWKRRLNNYQKYISSKERIKLESIQDIHKNVLKTKEELMVIEKTREWYDKVEDFSFALFHKDDKEIWKRRYIDLN